MSTVRVDLTVTILGLDRMKSGKRAPERDLTKSQDETELSSLMKLAQQGDSQGYRTLLLRVNEMIAQYVRSSFARLGLAETGAQEDVVQDILMAIHSKRATFDPSQFFLPWMYAIARYKIIDYVRKHGSKLRTTIPIEDELESLEAIETHSVSSEIDVMALCENLPPKQREIIKLVKIQGLSVAEASLKTGFSTSDIKVNVHRALKALQQQIKDSGYEN